MEQRGGVHPSLPLGLSTNRMRIPRFIGVAALLLSTGCGKDGATGPQGPAGADGSLTVNAAYFPNPPQAGWSGSGTTSYRTTFPVPAVTQDILLNGFVRVHFYDATGGDTVFTLLPFMVDDIPPVVTYSHSDSIGQVTVSTSIPSGFHQNPGGVFPGAQFGFRVVTIR